MNCKENSIDYVRMYNNCFKFTCKQCGALNDTIVKNVDVRHENDSIVTIDVFPLVKSDIFGIIDILDKDIVDLKLEIVDESGNVITEAFNSKYEMIGYYYNLTRSRICSDNQPLCVEIKFREV